MKNLLLLIAIIGLSNINAQNFDAFKFYNKKAKEISSKKLIEELADYDVVFIGEHHDNSINHWLEKRITAALFEKKNGQIILGAEMFERDNQQSLNSYLAGEINAKNLKDSVRLWKNYETDYRPLVDFAKDKKLSFIATNVPRKYASQTSKNGINRVVESLNVFMTCKREHRGSIRNGSTNTSGHRRSVGNYVQGICCC